MTRRLILGIDTGGTHTDAVVFDIRARHILASAKAPTTHHDLSLGISEVISKIRALNWPGGLEAIERIHLSTTLATNAITESQSSRVGLILIGYDPDQPSVREMTEKLSLAECFFVSGAHDFYGRETEPMDEEEVIRIAAANDRMVSAWAISGMFSVKNPSHELRASELIKKHSMSSITLGRDLTGQLDAVRRAATAALNAGLVVIINRLLNAVKQSAKSSGLGAAKLMVVKGDGSLVSEDWARAKPIETVVSGPAASLVGAKILAEGFLSESEKNLWVLDVGGTTTDMALVKNGLPAVNANGAKVGEWNTMTVAVQTRTTGLGGDSLVSINGEGTINIVPRRVLPLCRLARIWPEVVETLQIQIYERKPLSQSGCFFYPGLPPEPGLNQSEQTVIASMDRYSPLALTRLMEMVAAGGGEFTGLESLRHPSILLSAFTPTDAMSILGLYKEGSQEAALLGAELLGSRLKLNARQVAKEVLEECGRRLTQEIITYNFESEGLSVDPNEFKAAGLLGGALGRRSGGNIKFIAESADTVILLGAPVNVLSPFMSKYLKGRILVPPCFDAAGATGAAASPIYLNRQVEIHALPAFSGYRLFLPDEIIDSESVEDLVRIANEKMTVYLNTLARLAGAEIIEIAIKRDDSFLSDETGSIHLGVSLLYTIKEKHSSSRHQS